MYKIMEYARSSETAPKAQEYYGFHRTNCGWVYREWAPEAQEIHLAGEFNGWDWTSHPMLPLGDGNWVVFLSGKESLWEGCKVKISVDGVQCLPSHARRVRQGNRSISWCAEVTEHWDTSRRESAEQICQRVFG